MATYLTNDLEYQDPQVCSALEAEKERQQLTLELIASENIVSQAVLQALGHSMTNKTLEGYPGNRFHGGGENVDIVEQLAIERARELFDCQYVNVQPHSGTQANQAVFFSLLKPGDRVLGLKLSDGGHLSHGAAPNLSGKWFDSYHYGVNKTGQLIDYEQVENLAKEVRPKLLITGGSAYPRLIDFERMAHIARSVDAIFLVDMAHIAGLVAGGVHPSPVKHADIVTCTTTKTLRGPRGGMILANNIAWAKKLQSSVFPGVQGSIHSQIIAAKAVCLAEALTDEFKSYTKQILLNAETLAGQLKKSGFNLVTGGTDTHLILIDLKDTGLTGRQVENELARVNITCNSNPVPGGVANPSEWCGLRIGVAAATSRGLAQPEFIEIATIIEKVIRSVQQGHAIDIDFHQRKAIQLCRRFPIY